MIPSIPLDDILAEPSPCECQFTPYEPDDEIEQSWHYLRRCRACRETQYSLHCPHDGHQSSCGKCGARFNQIEEPAS